MIEFEPSEANGIDGAAIDRVWDSLADDPATNRIPPATAE